MVQTIYNMKKITIMDPLLVGFNRSWAKNMNILQFVESTNETGLLDQPKILMWAFIMSKPTSPEYS